MSDDQIEKDLKERLAPLAIATLEGALESTDDKLRAQTAQDILDRAGYPKKKESTMNVNHRSIPPEYLDKMLGGMKTVFGEITDVTEEKEPKRKTKSIPAKPSNDS